MHGSIATTAAKLRLIDGLIADLTTAMTVPIDARAHAVAESLAPLLGRDDLLDGCDCTPRDDRYARRLIHADPEGRFAVLSLVWCPGQASPIHAHRAWCAFGVQCGELQENYFAPSQGEALPALRSSIHRKVGATAHGPAAPDLIHQLANRSGAMAVSIHVYGVGLDAVETGVNRIYG